jgi:hypothetical protein
MSFIYPLLLGGLVLIGVPILLHLIMRQKPKHLLFPAFRFLLQRHRTNQRKLRLRHLLLLALRLFLIAGICLALARAKIFSDRLNLSSERPVAAVLIFDTSYSMEYTSGGQSRLEAAKRRALELLSDLPPESRIAVLDTAEPGGEWLPSLSLARDRIAELRLRPANGPVTSRLAEAYRLFGDLDLESDTGEDPMPRFLYVFSDRTQESWDASRVKDLQTLRDRLTTPVHAVCVDVGVDKPVDVALVSVELPRQVVPTHDKVVLRVTVRSTGGECDTEVTCRIDNEKTAERKPIKLEPGQSRVLTFERQGLTAGAHQAEIALATTDSLPFNNALFATFEIRGGRQVLTLVDDPKDADIWILALKTFKAFGWEVRKTAEARNLTPEDLAQYPAICLLNVAAPEPDLWQKLDLYVRNGGGLAIVPGGENLVPKAYNEGKEAQNLLPAQLTKIVKSDAKLGTVWNEASYQQHPVLSALKEARMSPNVDFEKFPPAAAFYWEAAPVPEAAHVLVKYADAKGRPALLERNFDRKKVRGRVLLFTTALDLAHLYGTGPAWNDYPNTSFYMILVNEVLGYLAGDAEEAHLNYQSGQTVTVSLPIKGRSPTYLLEGPGITATEATITRLEKQDELAIASAVLPGNYKVHGGQDGKWTTHFSVNVPPGESELARVPAEQIEQLLGRGAVLPVGFGTNFREALQGHWSQPIELFPWLMILILLVLAVENLLANKFYRREPQATEETPAPALPS